MAVALEQFVKQLADSGVIALGNLEKFIPPQAAPKNAQELARQLVQSKHLTKFQAQEIYGGRAKSLILGNYTILDKIGAGGMGQVFKAQHRRMERVVAIKMLPTAMMKDAAAAARFQREVVAASKLSHPNIVAAYDADEANGVHFLVMEYAEGSDLSALVKRNGPLPVAKAVNYILQAARGLEFAHGEGVVHRDIKPVNLLLDKKGTVKILDMGLARIDGGGDAATQAELTGTGAVLGTVDYMAPEQALSTKHADARADIYSLGCSLHYLVTAHAAYDGDSLMAKLLAHREQPIPSLGAEVPEEVQAVFAKMVAKKVQDRYQTMSEVVVALEQCSSGQQTSVSFQQPVDTNLDADVLTFLRDIPPHASHVQKKAKKAAPAKTATKVAPSKPGKDNKKLILGAVGAGFLGIAILAGVLLKLRTKDGTLVVEINQPDAVVQLLYADGKVEINQPGGKGSVTIAVDPGKHRLKVEKDGFKLFAKDFEMDSGGTASIKATLLEDRPWFKPAFLEWQKKVAAMPAEQQVEAVAKKLQELNPGFDGKLKGAGWDETPTMEYGVVTGLRLMNDNVTDISPFRALVGLKALACIGTSEGKGQLSDLSPLKGTSLIDLNCGWTHVADLSPLKGMRLIKLNCDGDPVNDLSPLDGMSLLGIQFSPSNVTKGIGVLRRMKSLTRIAPGSGNREFTPDAFWKRYDAGEFGKPASTTVNSDRKPITNINDPAFRQWMKTVAALPAEQQVDAVVKKLRELNPGFDGKESHSMDGGAVTGLDVATDEVIDLSPVRALVRLKYLRFTGGPTRTGKLADLSPMQGLPLTDLILDANKQLSDLSSLRGMPLTRLSLEETSVTDLTPLKGMKLADFNADLTPLVDISLLAGMPLKKLTLSHSRVSDLSPLRGMKLAVLTIGGTQVTDLSALKGMPIETLFCHESSISDLSPLKGMQIAKLTCHTTKVSDLTPLRGMPLVHLLIDKSPVADLSPLEGMNLTVFVFTPKDVTKGIEVLRRMKSVQNIGVRWDIVFPPNEFWKKYDAGEFGKPDSTVANPDRKPITNINDPAFQQWMKSVAALPAEEQVKAVVKKLMELNPGFDGKVTPTIENGMVTGVQFVTDQVKDISAVRALPGLTKLACYGSGLDKGLLSDLSPLNGMKLTYLNCGSTEVSDLSPLIGMPLRLFGGNNTPITNLTPLIGLPLVEIWLDEASVSDLSPLAEISTLSIVYVKDGRVTNLSPLKKLPLKTLDCDFQPERDADLLRSIKSLEKINGKPAAEFWKKYDAGEFNKPVSTAATPDRKPITNINDPAFQQWMKTVAALPAEQQVQSVAKKLQELNPGFDGKVGSNIDRGEVADLSLSVDKVTDISPARALVDLKALRCYGGDYGKSGQLADLTPIAGMRLTYLICMSKPIVDLSPVKGMPLENIDLTGTQVSDMSPLRGMHLKVLRCALNSNITDLTPLRGMPLTFIECDGTQVSDLSALRGMHLTTVSCRNTPIADLSPLEGMKLTNLYCSGTKVSLLSPLRGMPLTELTCYDTPLSDLSPLRDVPLTVFAFTPKNIIKGMDVIRQTKSLKTIGTSGGGPCPADEFWKKYDAGDFGKPDSTAGNPDRKPITNINDPAFQQWMKTVATLPAERQVEAVAKKLQELNPGFDGKETHKITDGVVTDLHFRTDNVTDISPVRALAGLKVLGCGGSGPEKGILFDLSPLKGLHLRVLDCGWTKVSDISSLKGMPLIDLSCGSTPVSDLTPLTGMLLTSLRCHETPVSDLSPLKGMPLIVLLIQSSSVSDLSPLQGMALNVITITPKKITNGLDTLRQMKSLTRIGPHVNDLCSPAEFWKKYDAGEFGK